MISDADRRHPRTVWRKKKLTEVPFSVIKRWHFSVEGFILTHENTFSNLTQLKVATDKTVEEK